MESQQRGRDPEKGSVTDEQAAMLDRIAELLRNKPESQRKLAEYLDDLENEDDGENNDCRPTTGRNQ